LALHHRQYVTVKNCLVAVGYRSEVSG
jgi:hypothetical protein